MRDVSRKHPSIVSVELDYSSSIFNFGFENPFLKVRVIKNLIFIIPPPRAALEP